MILYFFRHPDDELYLHQIAARIEGDPGNLLKLLRILEREGIFISEKRGVQRYFSLNKHYPFFRELQSLIQKAAPHPPEEVKGIAPPSETPRQGPVVFIIAGPNGSGKTTFARRFLPEYVRCRRFVNADLIAGGLSPFSPEDSALQAGKLILEQIKTLAGKGLNFGFETTLSGKGYQRLFGTLRRRGYSLFLFFLWIPTAELAVSRIRDRVKRGGHSIPEPVVRRRFARGIRNLFEIYRPLSDSWTLFDNSGSFPRLAAAGGPKEFKILDEPVFEKIKKQAGVRK